jgi:hypothetical protein
MRMLDESQYQELWFDGPHHQSLCVLINGGLGWMMYLPEPGSAGLSSRNPDYMGPADATTDYLLSNGQRDRYPASWALPRQQLENAIEYFTSTGRPAPFITWHDDGVDDTSDHKTAQHVESDG